MSPVVRRIVYVTIYEGIAIAVVTAALMVFWNAGLLSGGALAAITSGVAVVWNLAWNTIFEAWEARQAVRGRSPMRRFAHAVGFEGGLVVWLVPIFAWWLDLTLWQAFLTELGFLAFFFVYTWAFTWAFDRVFGLPASAR